MLFDAGLIAIGNVCNVDTTENFLSIDHELTLRILSL